MKRFMLCLLVFLLALTPSMAEDNMESLRVVGVSGDESIWRVQADNGQIIYFTSREADPFVQYQDINFDGIPDLTILTTRGASNFFYKLFVFSNNQYFPVMLMGYEGDAVNFQLHPEEKLISTHANNGYAGALFETTLYQWDGTDLYPVRKAASEEYKEASLNNATYTLITHLDQLHVTFRDYRDGSFNGVKYHEIILSLEDVTAETFDEWMEILWQELQ